MNETPPVLESPESSLWWRWSWILLALPLGLLSWVLATYNPAEHRIYPICAFYKTTGLHCPGCGGLRATHHLTNGRVQEAFENHPALILSLPLLTGVTGIWIWHRISERKEPRRIRKIYGWFLKGVMALFLIIGVLRNLPGAFQKLAPPPTEPNAVIEE